MALLTLTYDHLLPDSDDNVELDDASRDNLYLIPYTWWKEAQIDAGQTAGILYNVLLKDDDAGSAILLDLRKDGKCDDPEEEFTGTEHALVPEFMWLRALKWHNDSMVAGNKVSIDFHAEDYYVFSLKIRLSVNWETNSLLVKMNVKDNLVDLYERAHSVFSSRSGQFHIWEFSGQISHFFMNDKFNLPNDIPAQPGEEILLDLRIYVASDSMKRRDERNDKITELPNSGSVKMSGRNVITNPCLTPSNSSQLGSGYTEVGILGSKGLQNLGNTCFMNSAIQCLVHTPKLVDFFLGDYLKERDYKNPSGMRGEIALEFEDLLRKLWAPGATSVDPKKFKLKVSELSPRFSGYNQHDSQEFLSFLLDGLHEDLNHVISKPYIEVKDVEGRPDEEVAEEYFQNHRACNNSIIVDLFQGQYKSTLVCPVCKKVSSKFDPFMYLSMPLLSTTMRAMTLTVLSSDGKKMPSAVTVTVPKCGRFKDLIEALSTECSLRNDEALLVVEIYKNTIFRFLKELSDSLASIRDDDKLVAYRLPKDWETSPLVVFTHQREENHDSFGRTTSNWKTFGIPLVARLSDMSSGSDFLKKFLQLLKPFRMPIEEATEDYDDERDTDSKDTATGDVVSPKVPGSDGKTGDDPQGNTGFRFYMIQNKDISIEIEMETEILISRLTKILEVRVSWSEKMVEDYDTYLLDKFFTRRPKESISLYKCLEAFLKEEPLGPEDMWNCPSCKNPRQASKKLNLWRLPEILVIHLKRFSSSRINTNKLETYVDFPIDDLDLSTYISHKNGQSSNRYRLYATSNHHGDMEVGHYTAFAD
ncbi:UCH domain-containing protein, partial [Cephalotus follicularis]